MAKTSHRDVCNLHGDQPQGAGDPRDARPHAERDSRADQPRAARAAAETPARPPVVALDHVRLVFEHGQQALDDVSLRVEPGEWVCVLGANGSGKSTLAQVLAGLLAPDEGAVELVGELVCADGEPDLAAYGRARRDLGLVFQNPDDQIVTSVVEEDVAFGPENLGLPPDEIARRVDEELHRVALDDYAHVDPTRLSGGQKQRVAIAGALAMHPRLLVLDEPGALLDVRGRRSIIRVMRRLVATGTAVVHVTHFMDEALEADRVVVLDHGRMVLEGTPEEVFAKGDLVGRLGLEEPFAARLSRALAARGLDVAWTCDREALVSEVRQLLAATAGTVSTTRPAPAPPAAPQPARDAPAPDPQAASPAPPPSPDTAVCLEHVSFSYGNRWGRGTEKALDDVSARICHGTSVAVVGQTGSGKSTLARLLCALEVPDDGHVTVDGIDTSDRRRRGTICQNIGYVMQHPERQLFADTVAHDVAFGPQNLGLAQDEVERRCDEALTLVGLAEKRDLSPFELSGGQQRLAAMAGVLAMQPPTLVLDEPTAGLDPRGRHGLQALLDRLRGRGVTLVQVTHSMDDAARADEVVVIDRSRELMRGTPAEVFSAGHAKVLRASGLGLPRALEFAVALDDARVLARHPLTLEDLADAIAEEVRHGV